MFPHVLRFFFSSCPKCSANTIHMSFTWDLKKHLELLINIFL